MKLSHSQLETYSACPRKWEFRYIHKFRSPKISSPLFFGGALDEAFSRLLLNNKLELSQSEEELLKSTPEELFTQKMLVVDHNKQSVELAMSPFADYYVSDFVPELLGRNQITALQELEPSYKLANFIDFHLQCKEQLKSRCRLEETDQILYNYMNWLSLVEKGKLMIKAYETQIMPNIDKVYSIQKPISLKNEDNDEIVGLIDFTASFKNDPEVYICDNKTSSKAYDLDSVKTSQQLSTYCEAEDTNKAAYVVVEKKLYKKSPQIRTQIIKDTIPEETFVKTFDNFEKVCNNIESEKFPQNWDSCFNFGKICEYYAICKHNNYDGVVKLKEEK